MKNMRSKLMFMVSLLIMVLVFAGCSSDKEKDTATGDKGKSTEGKNSASDVKQELVFATTAEAIGLSPIGTWDTPSGLVNNQLYESLFEVDFKEGVVIPLLAESYENPDELTWVIKLKEGIKFHDGTPFNAEAVKFSFETQADPKTASPSGHLLAFMESITVLDEYTIEFKTKEPNPNTLPLLANRAVSIVSPEAYKNQDIMQKPVGTGSYKFESWTHGDRIVLVRNDDYWGEKTRLDKLTYLVVPDDSTAVSMLETGEVGFTNVSEPALLPRMEAMKNVELLRQQGGSLFHVSFNMTKAPMNELEFRKAVAMGIDTDSFIDSLGGTAFKSAGLFGPAVLDYDESIEEHGYDYDPEAAKKIVEENGYGDHELTLFARNDSGSKRQAEVAQAELTKIGLKVKIEMMEPSTYMEKTAKGDHDMFVGGSSNSVTGLETLYFFYHSDNIGGNNRTHVSSDAFDKLVDEARRTMDDEKRQELINEAHEMVIDEAFMVPMYHGVNTIPHATSVKGLIISPSKAFFLQKVYRE